MATARFARYVLRTTHVATARALYTAVLGHEGDHVWPLHEQALARGTRPHAKMRGLAQPPSALADGTRFAVCGDAYGAVFGLHMATLRVYPLRRPEAPRAPSRRARPR